VPATPTNTITPRREIKNYQVSKLINLAYVALGSSPKLRIAASICEAPKFNLISTPSSSSTMSRPF
jgi:hypothetical protein